MTPQAEQEINRKLDMLLGINQPKKEKETFDDMVEDYRLRIRRKYLRKNLNK